MMQTLTQLELSASIDATRVALARLTEPQFQTVRADVNKQMVDFVLTKMLTTDAARASFLAKVRT